MRFSLIVPVYNVADYLPCCMDSLLRQDFQDYEIILVDDGSTDGKSGVLCDQYAAQHPNVHVIHQENGGLGAARNTGLEHASGEYVFFIDSDDYIAPDSLSKLNAAAQQTPADMYVFRFCYVHGQTFFPAEPSRIPLHTLLTLSDHPEILLAPPSACFRICKRALFMEHDIRFPGRVWYEDLRTTPKCLFYAEGIVYLPDVIYYYVQRDSSIMHSSSHRRNLEILDALEALRVFFLDKSIPPELRDALRYLDVDHCLMAAQRVLAADPGADYLPAFMEYVRKNDPDYRHISMLHRLGRKKLIVLRLLEHGHYRLLSGLFSMIHHLRSHIERQSCL